MLLFVDFNVLITGAHFGEGLGAYGTGVRLEAVVAVGVFVKRLLSGEGLAAEVAHKGPFAGMDAMVALEIAFGQELGVAVATVPPFDAFVTENVKP